MNDDVMISIAMATYNGERTVWLGGNEIRKRILEHPASLAGFVRADGTDDSDEEFEVQVVYDSGRDLISDGDWSYDDRLVEARFGGESMTESGTS